MISALVPDWLQEFEREAGYHTEEVEMPNGRKKVALTRHALKTLSSHGIKYKQSHGGIGRATRTTILGRGRAPRYVFPKARWNWAKLSY